MYSNVVWYRYDGTKGLSVEVNKRMAGNYSVLFTDTDANEIISLTYFQEREHAIVYANNLMNGTQPETEPYKRG